MSRYQFVTIILVNDGHFMSQNCFAWPNGLLDFTTFCRDEPPGEGSVIRYGECALRVLSAVQIGGAIELKLNVAMARTHEPVPLHEIAAGDRYFDARDGHAKPSEVLDQLGGSPPVTTVRTGSGVETTKSAYEFVYPLVEPERLP